MKITVLFNPECSKCNHALSKLEESGCSLETIEYLKQPPTTEELSKLVQMLGISAEQLVRKTEEVYKEKYEGKELSEEEWIKAMVENPVLIQRPILIRGNRAVIGRDDEQIEEILK